jgi:hypothetical protein
MDNARLRAEALRWAQARAAAAKRDFFATEARNDMYADAEGV